MNYNSQQNNFIPKQDTSDLSNAIFDKSTYNEVNSFQDDAINDLKRWVRNFDKVVDKYSEEKYLYEKEKELKVEDEESRQQMKDSVSADKGFLEDMRKGFDWYKNTFGEAPDWFKEFRKKYSIELKRLKKLKKYLSYRVRSLAGRGMYNEPSKDILQYIRIRIDTVNILFDPKYNERRPLDEIHDDEDREDIYGDENPNKLFYPYD